MQSSSLKRTRRGSAIILTVALCLTLVVIGLGYLAVLMFIGGQNETQNACDSGALNLAKRVLDDVNIGLWPEESSFLDVTNDKDHPENDGKVNLRRINRIWAKAILFSLNAKGAKLDGNVGSGEANARVACFQARNISSRLWIGTRTRIMQGFFSDVAESNSVRMLGSDCHISVRNNWENWEYAMLNEGKESNIVISDLDLPPGIKMPPDLVTKCTRNSAAKGAADLTFVRGYTDLGTANPALRSCALVSFPFDEKPHLISRNEFEVGLPSLFYHRLGSNNYFWSLPPNAFSCEAVATGSRSPGQRAMSYVLTNPRETFKLCIPHSFVRIHLDQTKAKFFYYPLGIPGLTPRVKQDVEVEYGPVPFFHDYLDGRYLGSDPSGPIYQRGIGMMFGGPFCRYVTASPVPLGFDIAGQSVDEFIFGPPPGGDTRRLEAYLVNRANEMISKVGVVKTASDIHAALRDADTNILYFLPYRDLYLFSPDGEKLLVLPEPFASAQAPWLSSMINNGPDGTESKLIDNVQMPGITFTPTVIPLPFFKPIVKNGWESWHKSVYWQPGTGYNGNLGQLRVTRWTEVDSLGICAP